MRTPSAALGDGSSNAALKLILSVTILVITALQYIAGLHIVATEVRNNNDDNKIEVAKLYRTADSYNVVLPSPWVQSRSIKINGSGCIGCSGFSSVRAAVH